MKRGKINKIMVFVATAGLLCSSCDNFFDVNTDEIILNDDNYKSKGEVYSGFVGIASTMQQAADHYIILSELLGDLVTPTSQAPLEFWEVYRYRPGKSNKLVSPEPFYKIILNSNDFLRSMVKFHKENSGGIPELVYNGMISSAITYRTWAYLTIGKIYGEAIYYDLALSDNTDMSGQQLMSLDELIGELIHFMKTGVGGVDAFQPLEWKELMGMDANDWYYMTVNANVLMAELYLWQGSHVESAMSALDAIYSGVGDDGKASLDKYKLSGKISWKNIFAGDYGTIGNEAFTVIPFDYSKGQTNKLQYYFSNIEPNVYYVKPHNNMINRYQILQGKIYTDPRGKDISYIKEGGEYVIARYHMGKKPYEHDRQISIYRAVDAWLMLAEALNESGNFAQADSILNVGLSKSWSGSVFKEPFNLPIYRADLQKNLGIRGNVGARPNYLKYYVVDSLYQENELQERKRIVLDSLIAEEVALELAFEGKRWYTLVRMARKNNRPELLAKPMSEKFGPAERELYRMWLMEPQNWFIKYDQLNVVSE